MNALLYHGNSSHQFKRTLSSIYLTKRNRSSFLIWLLRFFDKCNAIQDNLLLSLPVAYTHRHVCKKCTYFPTTLMKGMCDFDVTVLFHVFPSCLLSVSCLSCCHLLKVFKAQGSFPNCFFFNQFSYVRHRLMEGWVGTGANEAEQW